MKRLQPSKAQVAKTDVRPAQPPILTAFCNGCGGIVLAL
jgi:hypothetical protein